MLRSSTAIARSDVAAYARARVLVSNVATLIYFCSGEFHLHTRIYTHKCHTTSQAAATGPTGSLDEVYIDRQSYNILSVHNTRNMFIIYVISLFTEGATTRLLERPPPNTLGCC